MASMTTGGLLRWLRENGHSVSRTQVQWAVENHLIVKPQKNTAGHYEFGHIERTAILAYFNDKAAKP